MPDVLKTTTSIRYRRPLATAAVCSVTLLASCGAQTGAATGDGTGQRQAESLVAAHTALPDQSDSTAEAARALAPAWSGKVITRIPTSKPVVALTIDCGANQAAIPSMLSTLRQAHVPATFFLTGQFARSYPSAVRKIVADGHLVGNHSDTHPNFAQLSTRTQTAQLRKARRSIMAAGAADPTPWFRFPFGSSNRAAVQTVNRAGYAAFGWTVDSLGWLGTSGGQSVRSVKKRVLGAATPGEIVLMHCGSNPKDRTTLDAAALPAVIQGLSRRGYTFATLAEAMR